jgi:uncharacterized protein with gpF-like domain
MARKTKKKTAKPNLPNAGLEAEYRRKLDKLIKGMNDDIQRGVESLYGRREDEITEDASPSKALIDVIAKIMKKWTFKFDTEAEVVARWFVTRSDNSTKVLLGKSLAKAAGMTVKFKTTKAVEDVLDGLVAENVSLIKSIPEQYHTQVNTQVMDSVRVGRDLGGLTNELDERYAITRRKAAMIAKDQNNKATEAIGLERNKSLGITHGVWMHRSGSKEPRGSHIQANGKMFALDDGLMVDGEMIFPGQKINCNCTFRPVIPGLK